ncbi:uncharacterized protein CPUR_05658 [Claviceps purpurea 20.1]|uniref:F-box domain-containing protein n=1 Tax=Claviceps purpurea (strain 20.1) TaxID=1111077 RepID=M1WCS9_CLAP2|nr:uncharacterized protein CPUR_05658 [Claviceps purpurea 20.1]
MESAAREARLTARERNTDESRCLMALLPPETKMQIMSYISTQRSLSRLSQSCRAWYETATEELYTRDAKEHRSFAMKWMAAHAVDEQTTDSAIRTLETSRRWGGQIDAIQRGLTEWESLQDINTLYEDLYEASTALHFAIVSRNMRLTETLLDMKASLRIPGLPLLWKSKGSKKLLRRFRYFQQIFEGCSLGLAFPIFMAFLQSDSDMCKLLIAHGAGSEATLVNTITGPKAISILHFAAADLTTKNRQWQCLFHGFNLTAPAPELPSPLYLVLDNYNDRRKWLLNLLCEKGATIHEDEVNAAFLYWCETSILWETNAYDAWWQHQGQEDETFQKWCEHPYNAWWWRHVKQISPMVVSEAYKIAFNTSRQLYDILTHLPLPAPHDNNLLFEVAFDAMELWSWRVVVQRESEVNLLAFSFLDERENMIHLTVRKYHDHSCYSAADTILDILHLRDQGVSMSSPNSQGQTPLELLLSLDSRKDDFSEMVALLEEEMRKHS